MSDPRWKSPVVSVAEANEITRGSPGGLILMPYRRAMLLYPRPGGETVYARVELGEETAVVIELDTAQLELLVKDLVNRRRERKRAAREGAEAAR